MLVTLVTWVTLEQLVSVVTWEPGKLIFYLDSFIFPEIVFQQIIIQRNFFCSDFITYLQFKVTFSNTIICEGIMPSNEWIRLHMCPGQVFILDTLFSAGNNTIMDNENWVIEFILIVCYVITKIFIILFSSFSK